MLNKWPLGRDQFLAYGYYLNNLDKGPQDEATYQISKAWVFYSFRQEDF